METQRSHYKLNDALIERAGRLAALGWSQKNIAEACGVHHDTLGSWLASGATEHGTDEECRLYRVIHEAYVQGEAAMVRKIAEGDTKDAQWLLTHSPRWRNTWSDGAAVRRALAAAADVVLQSDLTPDQQKHLLLRMQAAGLGSHAG